jgi:hypothetical protein
MRAGNRIKQLHDGFRQHDIHLNRVAALGEMATSLNIQKVTSSHR